MSSMDVERLYRDHHPHIHAIITRRVSDPALADDLTHDTFTLALRHLRNQGATPQDPRAWLATIALNRVRTLWRSSRHKLEVPIPDFHDSSVWGISSTPGPEQIAVDRDAADWNRRHLAHHVAELGPRSQEAIGLRFTRGFSVADTARAMGCETGTVKSTTSRALRRLRASLSEVVV